MTARRISLAALLAAIVFFPWLPGVKYSLVVNANQAAEYALIAFSLVILTGWVGQISLGQGSFVGIGAFVTGLLIRRYGIPFPLNLPIVAVLSAGVATLLGLVALRVRGLYLAVATLIFAWMADAYLFTSSWLVGAGGASSIEPQRVGQDGTVTFFDLSNKRVLYLVMVAAVALAWFAAVNLRDSKTGRAFFAVRGSETAAVSLGIDITRYKLLAFAISGGLAGVAGNLMMIDLRAATPFGFQFTTSLFFLSIAVVGGVASLGGAVAASVLFAGLNEAFFRLKFLNGLLDIVTVGLLLFVLLVYPGGLGALGEAIVRRGRPVVQRFRAWVEDRYPILGPAPEPAFAMAGGADPKPRRRPRPDDADLAARADMADAAPKLRQRLPNLPSLPMPLRRRPPVVRRTADHSRLRARLDPPKPEPAAPSPTPTPNPAPEPFDWRTAEPADFTLPPRREDRAPILQVEHVTVRFGGLVAANDVSLEVREHEIVGLIGPNGAGKTTTFNAISGLNEPAEGTVKLFGEDATKYPVHLRAQMGVGRTFQLIQLFPQLTVFENLLVATHVHNETGVFSHVMLTERAVGTERDCRRRVRDIIGLLGLEAVADRKVAGLPFGILRQVEIARALVTEAPFVMLDEPASGLDNTETDELARLLYFIRAELGVSLLLIEHDVRMVTSVSDYMYVINRGALLAEGTPADIQRNPEVVAAYLGDAAEEVA